MSPPVLVILNPLSGGRTGRRVRPEIERELSARKLEFHIRETEYAGHAVEIARDAARNGTRTILAAGGDGTVHEVANGIIQARNEKEEQQTNLGIIPIGTGNDLVKAVIGGTDRTIAYDVIANGTVRRLDIGNVEWDGGNEYFVNAAGTGIDVEVVRQVARAPRMPGLASYLLGLLRALIRFRPISIRARIDETEFEGRVMIIAVGNGHSLGGGFYFTPNAEPDDGWFDVCIVKKLNAFQVLPVLIGILRGEHGKSPHVIMKRARTVEITVTSSEPLFFQLDGELREPDVRSMHVRIASAVLPVIAPVETKTAGDTENHENTAEDRATTASGDPK